MSNPISTTETLSCRAKVPVAMIDFHNRSPVGKPTICEPRRHQYGCTRVRLLTPFLLDLAQASAGFWVRLGGGGFVHAASVLFLAVSVTPKHP